MELNKKTFLALLFSINSLFCYSISLVDLINYAVDSNIDIQRAKLQYEQQCLSSKNSNGAYVASVEINGTLKIPGEYNWNNAPDSSEASIMYRQPLPGGTQISIETDYSFNSLIIDNETFVLQNPNITFSLSQSLLPFWLQGSNKDPVKLSFEYNKQYAYLHLLNTKKDILLQLIQNYYLYLITLNDIKINTNTLNLYDEQIKSLKELNAIGNTSKSIIIEAENNKWSTEQSLIVLRTNSMKYIQLIKNLCGQNFDESLLDLKFSEDIIVQVRNILDGKIDPLDEIYKLQIVSLQNSRVLEKQSTAPLFNVSVKSNWQLEPAKQNEWSSAWENFSNISGWSINMGVNFSPMIEEFQKHNKSKYELEYDSLNDDYSSYLLQKSLNERQYNTLLSNSIYQYERVKSLYESGMRELFDYEFQYKNKAISKFEYDSVKVRVENTWYTISNLELYISLYKICIDLL